MTTTTLTSREFNQAASRAKKAAGKGPVVITDRGRPSHVLLSYDEYLRLTGHAGKLADVFTVPAGVEDVDLDLPAYRELVRPADLG